jgi:hypothetical protein
MILIFRFFIPHSAFRIPRLKYLIVLVFLMLCVSLPDGGLQAMPPVQRMVLPNQLVLLVCEEHSLPFVTFQLLIDSGDVEILLERKVWPTSQREGFFLEHLNARSPQSMKNSILWVPLSPLPQVETTLPLASGF